MVLDARRKEANRADCCCCWVVSSAVQREEEARCCAQKPGALRRFMGGTYATCLLNPVVKVAVVFFFTALFGVSIFGATKLEQEFDFEWFTPSDSYLQDYYIQR